MLAILVLALGLATEVANADFTFGTPTNLGSPVNSTLGEIAPTISDDGLELFFMSNRPGGYGIYDLWVATRATKDDDWGEPVNLGSTVNSSADDAAPSISGDGLSLYFTTSRTGGSGDYDLWVTTRPTKYGPWGTPANLGPTVNSSYIDSAPSISADGLALFFSEYFQGPYRPGGFGMSDLWVTTRPTKDDPWGEPVNLGATVNSSAGDMTPSISADGLSLFFHCNRPGGSGGNDLWVTTRETTNDPWGPPVNLGPTVNTASAEIAPSISHDGRDLYFSDFGGPRPGGVGGADLWQVSIEPVVDLNGDGIVDSADMCIMVDYWGTDEPLCDIGPMPWGDGVVDVQDLIVLAEHLFEEPGLIAY
jgi:Tol biopolymer transport system component